MKIKNYLTAAILIASFAGGAAATKAQENSKPTTATPQTASNPATEEWGDDFSGDRLDEKKWEKFTFEGGAGGKLEVKNGAARIRSQNKTRAGIRTKNHFSGDRFAVEARVAKVGAAFPEPGGNASTLGFGALTILFDGSGRNRIEWMLTSEGTLEAWSIVDGRGERLDGKKLRTKIKNPVLLVGRRGDEFSFYLNDPQGAAQDAQRALTTTIKNLPKSFHVMLYGYGSSENDWDAVRVVVPKQ